MKTEQEKNEILRLSNEESNKLTKRCLQEALIELMAKKKFENITITELVKRAGVSRNAFYRNYSSKEDIILEISDLFIITSSNLINSAKSVDNRYNVLHDLFTSIKENSRNITLLLQAGLYNSLLIYEYQLTEKLIDLQSTEDKYAMLSVNSAICAIIMTWFKEGMKEDIDFMIKVCMNILDKLYE